MIKNKFVIAGVGVVFMLLIAYFVNKGMENKDDASFLEEDTGKDARGIADEEAKKVRSELARKAANARWKGKKKKAQEDNDE